MLAHKAQGITGPGKFQEQPKSAQEWPGKAPGWIWASWPTWLRAARSRPGSSRSSPRAPRSGQKNLLVGFGHPVPWQAHRGAGSQEQPRKLQEQLPEYPGDELLAGFEHPWPKWLRAGWQNERVSRGGLYLYNTLTCVGRKGDA